MLALQRFLLGQLANVFFVFLFFHFFASKKFVVTNTLQIFVGLLFKVTRSDISSTTVARSSEVGGCGVEGPFYV